MKQTRHAAILRLVRAHRVENQEQLRRLLADERIETTQATLSRDIRELRLVKATSPDGTSHYQEPAEGGVTHPALAQLLPALLGELDGVGNLLLVRTPAGSANALASALDAEGWNEVVGTLAGDDTILVITRSDRARRAVANRLTTLAGLRA